MFLGTQNEKSPVKAMKSIILTSVKLNLLEHLSINTMWKINC